MPNVSKVLTIIIINVCVLFFINVVSEYTLIEVKLRRIDQILSVALDQALTTSIRSEEFFTEKGGGQDTGVEMSVLMNAKEEKLGGVLTYAGGWQHIQPYKLAKYMEQNGKIPLDGSDVEGDIGGVQGVYEWLYGEVGSNLPSWYQDFVERKAVSVGETVGDVKIGGSKNLVSEFKEYYEQVGKEINSEVVGVKKVVSGSDVADANIEYGVYAGKMLWLMGLNFPDVNDRNTHSTYMNFKNGVLANPQINTTCRIGKDRSNGDDTVYFYTPNTLGVTYVPVKVLKPILKVNIDTLVRLNKVKVELKEEDDGYATGDGRLGLGIHRDGVLVEQGERVGSEWVNDGMSEYDLSSLKVKVDYKVVDFYDPANGELVKLLEGYMGAASEVGAKLKERDIGRSDYSDGKRVVAKVTAKIKVNIPYSSQVLQWYRSIVESGVDGYGIRGYNPTTGGLVSDKDGVWYEVSEYVSVRR